MMQTKIDSIYMLVHELKNDGVSNSTVMLANAIAEKNTDVMFVVMGEKAARPSLLNEHIGIKFLGMKKGERLIDKVLYMVRAYFILSTYFAQKRTHNVIAWGRGLTTLAVILRTSLPLQFKLIGVDVTVVPQCLQNQYKIIRKTVNNIYKFFLANPNNIITYSNSSAVELNDVYNITKDKITVLPPVLQDKFFHVVQEKNKSGKILFIDDLVAEKDPLSALVVFKELNDLRKSRTPGVDNIEPTLIFIGDGDLQVQLAEKITEYNLEKHVSIIGSQADILPLLSDADAVIATSIYENSGYVLAQAIACGVPVISFDSSAAEIIIDGINGYLIPWGDIDLFARKLDLLLTKNWNSQRIAETANKFHPDSVLKDYIEVIRAVFTPAVENTMQ